jgi:hypothetical protein
MPSRLMVRLGRSAASLLRTRPVQGVWVAKATVAAVVSFVLADVLGTSVQPVIAPLTALLVLQVNTYDTLTRGVRRIGSVLAGVLVAIQVAKFVGLTWWSLGGVVAVSLLLGMLLRLGPELVEVPISAMLVLAVGGAEDVALGRVYETLVGAAAGVLVDLVASLPPSDRPAGAAIGDLASRMANVLRGLAGDLRSTWSQAAADHWLNQARALGAEVTRAGQSLEQVERSAMLNPRARNLRQTQPRLRTALTGLEHCYLAVRNLCRALFDRTYFLPPERQPGAYDEDERVALADVLDCAATALDRVTAMTSGAIPVETARADVEAHLNELRRLHDRLGDLLVVDPRADQTAWQQHGALLAAVDRLRAEVEAAVRPTDGSWRPPTIAEWQLRAIRRAREHIPRIRPGRETNQRKP